jgi:hypothetical protein
MILRGAEMAAHCEKIGRLNLALRMAVKHWRLLAVVLLLAIPSIIVADCDDSLWHHVYKPERLMVHKMCVTVTGTIVDATHGTRKDGVRHEPDGDCHGWLKLDPGQEQYLNDGNISHEDGNLVFEIVCMFHVSQEDAKRACAGYQNKVDLLPIGTHVCIDGTWVTDDNHAHWFEIHPVSAIRRCSVIG